MTETEAACICPTCGTPFAAERPTVDLNGNVFVSSLGSARLEPQEAEILWILTEKYPAVARRDFLIARMYGMGFEPERSSNVLSTRISQMRKKIAGLGFTIVPIERVGYRLAPAADRPA